MMPTRTDLLGPADSNNVRNPMGIREVQKEVYHSGASDIQDLNQLIPFTALVETTTQSASEPKLMLMAVGRAQEHMSSRVPMAPKGAALSGVMVQIGPKDTQKRLRPRVLCLWDWRQQPPCDLVLGRQCPCHSQTPSKALLPISWPNRVKKA